MQAKGLRIRLGPWGCGRRDAGQGHLVSPSVSPLPAQVPLPDDPPLPLEPPTPDTPPLQVQDKFLQLFAAGYSPSSAT